jgi:hypothetical protein
METPPPPPPPRPPRGPAPLDRDATARPADAFSLGKMREAMDTRVTQAKADLQRALASTRESLATPTSSSETSNGGPYPTINAFTELARRVPDTVAKLAPDDNVLLSRVRTAAAQRVGGMRRSSTADQLASGDHFFGRRGRRRRRRRRRGRRGERRAGQRRRGQGRRGRGAGDAPQAADAGDAVPADAAGVGHFQIFKDVRHVGELRRGSVRPDVRRHVRAAATTKWKQRQRRRGGALERVVAAVDVAVEEGR